MFPSAKFVLSRYEDDLKIDQHIRIFFLFETLTKYQQQNKEAQRKKRMKDFPVCLNVHQGGFQDLFIFHFPINHKSNKIT